MKLNKSYSFKLKVNKQQSLTLKANADASRFVWNWALETWENYYKNTGKTIHRSLLSSMLTKERNKKGNEWIKSVNAQSTCQVLEDLRRSYSYFFDNRCGIPRFKSKKTSCLKFRIPQYVKVENGYIKCHKIPSLKLIGYRNICGKIKSATFKMDTLGDWYVCILTEEERHIEYAKADNNIVGVDVGLKDFVVTSDGDRVEAKKIYRKLENKLKSAQRELCRKNPGSVRRQKARRKVSSIHIKIKNKRNDFIHKLTSVLVKKHNVICIEDLNVKGLARTKLAKSIHDASFGEFRRQLEYKTLWNGKHLICIDRFYPSSKKCSICGNINKELKLSDREWTCLECNTKHDRDLNAAINIKNEGARMLGVDLGHKDTINARGEAVRPPVMVASFCEVSNIHSNIEYVPSLAKRVL